MTTLIGFDSVDDIIANYDAPKDALDGAEVLLAWYGYGDYDGASFVLYRKDGKLWEVNGGHCSCYGLEGQWDPEETTVEALRKRPWSEYSTGEADARDALQSILGSLE